MVRVSTKEILKIYCQKELAGHLMRAQDEYIFEYEESYFTSKLTVPISLTLPKTQRSHQKAGRLHPFFEGLLHEGWLRQHTYQHDLEHDELAMLAARARESIGAIEILRENDTYHPLDYIKLYDDYPCDERPIAAVQRTHCYLCRKPLSAPGKNGNYHEDCAHIIFGHEKPPRLDITSKELDQRAIHSASSGIAIPGMQKKYGFYYSPGESFFILKPPVYYQGKLLPFIPEIEHAWMRSADELGVPAALSGIIELKDRKLAYVTRRFDRGHKGQRLVMEDFAQLLGKTGNDEQEKFRGSIEDVAASLKKFARPSWPAIQRLFKATVLNLLMGNNDAHLKNFSLIAMQARKGITQYTLAPLYDFLPTRFLNNRGEQSALTLAGKRMNIRLEDLLAVAENHQIDVTELAAFARHVADSGALLRERLELCGVSLGKTSEILRGFDKRKRAWWHT